MAGLDGSWRPSRSHSQAKTGAKPTTNTGSTDWYQLDGKDQPNITLRVYWSAKRFRLLPACSNPIQNSVAKTKSTMIAPMRLRSVVLRAPVRSSQAKSTAVRTSITQSR